MMESPKLALSQGFLPTWFALSGIVAVQMIGLFLLPESANPRPMAWSGAATVAVLLTLGTLAGSALLPRVRPMVLLIGAMCVTLLAMRHGLVEAHQPSPPQHELFVFYTVAAILLAAGAYDRAARTMDVEP